MTDSRAGSDPVRINPRVARSVLAQAVLAAAVSCWLAFLWSAPRFPPAGSDQGSGGSALGLVLPVAVFLVTWRVLLGRTTEWTVAGGRLLRRSWLSMPGGRPKLVAELGREVEIQHQTRSRWQVWPSGHQIDLWPGQTAALVEAMRGNRVQVDDFRGDWERSHARLNMTALICYGSGLAIFLATPAVGIATASQLPLLPLIAAGALFGLGQVIDSQPWKASRPVGRTGYLHK